jgi:hypothetical protein
MRYMLKPWSKPLTSAPTQMGKTSHDEPNG